MMLALDTSHALWRWFLVSIALLCVPLVLISGCAHIDENRVRSPSSELQNKQVENDVEAEMVASVFSVLTVDQADSIYPREIDPEASRAAGLSKSGELSEEYLAAAAAYMSAFNQYLCNSVDLNSYQDNLDSHPWGYSSSDVSEALKVNGGFGRNNIFIRSAAYVERLNEDDLALLLAAVDGDSIGVTQGLLDMVARTYPTVFEVRNERGEAQSSVVYRDAVFDPEIASGNALVFVIAYQPEFDDKGYLLDEELERNKAEIVQATRDVMEYEISRALGCQVVVFIENI